MIFSGIVAGPPAVVVSLIVTVVLPRGPGVGGRMFYFLLNFGERRIQVAGDRLHVRVKELYFRVGAVETAVVACGVLVDSTSSFLLHLFILLGDVLSNSSSGDVPSPLMALLPQEVGGDVPPEMPRKNPPQRLNPV